MLRLHFVLVAEGTSERGLLPHLETLCVRAGADEVTSAFPEFSRLADPPGKSVSSQVAAALVMEPDASVVFVHRDADASTDAAVRSVMNAEIARVPDCPASVPVIPIQELEAWLLLDEAEIRAVVGNAAGKAKLGLPSAKAAEGVARPKERLKAALAAASEKRGRRLDAVRREFPEHRRLLLERLNVDGPVSRLPAWKALVAGIKAAVTRLKGQA